MKNGVNSRRYSVEVIADILRLGEAGKTEIIYSANLSFRQLQKYLSYPVQEGFLETKIVPNPGVKYRVTPRGAQLLNSIDAMLSALGASQ